MTKKTIIQITVIGACFVVSGLVLYNGLFKTESPPLDQTAVSLGTSAPVESNQILPHGETFDLSKVFNKTKFQFGQVTYPKLNFNQDVGIDQRDLIQPLPTR